MDAEFDDHFIQFLGFGHLLGFGIASGFALYLLGCGSSGFYTRYAACPVCQRGIGATAQDEGGNVPRMLIEALPEPIGNQIWSRLRNVLRERYWCRFEDESRFVHFGYDYYMYVGDLTRCADSQSLARTLDLFPEEFESPYRGR